ncbi:MAG: ABC transporter permease [Ruminococcaceae bacterium]|nr:ABC transporter permease [Oscillospiraceae bacterium]
MDQNKKQSQIKEIWRRLKKNKPAIIGLVVFLALIFLAIFGEMLIPYEQSINIDMKARLQPPSAEHIFGTDSYGRDQFARVVHSAKISVTIGVVGAMAGLIVGSILGAVSTYYGGVVDLVIMRFIDVLAAIPYLLLAMVVVATMGASMTNLIIAIGVSSIPLFTRLARSNMLTITDQGYVEAARTYGASPLRIMFRHVIPNAAGPLIVQFTMSIADSILTASSLSYLGLGIKPPTPEWGGMLNAGRNFMLESPYLLWFPGLALILAALSISLLGDGLRDALDPKLKT